jgi:NhaA family Na+:H+ antiporter
VHACGVHATISGVILGMLIPGRLRHEPRQVLRELNEHGGRLLQKAEDEALDAAEVLMIEDRLQELASPLARFIHGMHGLMAFWIMPIFALANAGVPLRNMSAADLTAGVTAGAALGLLVGKAGGIFAFTVAAVRAGVAPMPGGASRTKLLGTAVVAGIGFTVAIFIAGLAFGADDRMLSEAKLGILLGSLGSGLIGAAILLATPRLAETA